MIRRKNKVLRISRKSEEENEGNGDDGRTVVVGLKLDSQSKELLTWALVKVANPGDQVIAVNVLNDSEIVNGEGNSSLLSLVKAFDSVLAVYEGFCNLKQVDLKLKICRGSGTGKVLVKEAKSYFASKLIVGSSRKHRGIGLLSTSIARYCARKLSKDCAVLAVNNGKVIFQREATRVPRPANGSKGVDDDDHSRKSLLGSIRGRSKKNPDLPSDAASNEEVSNQHSLEDNAGGSQTTKQYKCPICSSVSILLHSHCTKPAEENLGDGTEDNRLALVPVPQGKKLSRRTSVRELPLIQWAIRLPKLFWSVAVHPDHHLNSRERKEDRLSCLDGESDAIVLVGAHHNALASPECESKDLPKGDYCSLLDGETGAIVLVGNNDPKDPPEKDRIAPLDGESGAMVLVGNNPSAFPDDESTNLPKKLEFLHEKYSSTCRLFVYQELATATSNFSSENLIGSGGSSHVYRGCLPDGKELAVKILKPSDDDIDDFVLEIEIITTLNHKNIVSLVGFCFEDSNLLLVYDFLSRGSLEENLYGTKKDKASFGWEERYKVALGVAEALAHLHSGSAQSVIHRDVKSSNILLSDDFVPQLSDFGLAKWASTSSTHIICADVAGTFGYLAPEYFMYGKLNDKVDVYAFGVVLLELISGRKPISNEYPKGQESLVMWAKLILNSGKITELLDPSLGDNYTADQMEIMALAATLCIRRSPRARPTMNLVLKLLQGDPEAIKWSRLQVSTVEEFDALDDEEVPSPSFQSHLNLALGDVEDDSLSDSSIEQNISLEDYLQGRWSRTSSFD
ncbi:hypothetical protein ACHQM5_022940 [Ranunculus cassubicifolius]